MKITFFIGSMCRGGAERVISILANDYAAKGWNVDIVVLLHEAVEYPLNRAVRIVNLVGTTGSYTKNAAFWFKGIRDYLKKAKPECVLSFVGRINALVLTAAWGLKIPIVVSERNDPKHDGRGKLMQMYCNCIYRKAKAVIFQNEYEKTCFDDALTRKSYIIPNPVSVTTEQKKVPQQFKIITAGRLTEQKNQAMLIEAMSLVHREYPEVKCEIYGEGNLREWLQSQIEMQGLTEVMSLKGNVMNIHEQFANSSIFVLTSNFEGLSNALIEAMMVGLPCITTDYPGASELIRDGENGLIVPCGDSRALAKAILALLENNNGVMRRFAENAKKSSEQFKAERVLNLWHSVIEGQ